MRKVAFTLAVVMLVMALASPAMAVEPRAITIAPGLDFNGTTAICSASIVANYITDELVATIRLWTGTACVKTWVVEGDGYIFFEETHGVAKCLSYKLTVDLTVNGVACSQVYVTGTC